jgi:hypothetical protein
VTSTADTGRPRARRAPGRSFTGLLRALLPVLAVLLFVVWWQRVDPTPVASVDPGPDIAYAQRISPVPLPGPWELPAGWRATTSRVDAPAGEGGGGPVTLTVGYLTPADRYAEVVVGDQVPVVLLRDRVAGAARRGSTPIGAASWDRYESTRGEPVLVRRIGAATVLVTGDASDTDLATLAGAVR